MTVVCISIITLYLFFNLNYVYSVAPNDTEIILAHVIFRHGERTTFKFYPTDPHRNETFYPIGLSGLTNNGKLMMFTLGEILRERYGNLLGEDYTQRKLEVRSTGRERTIMSAMLVLAGLWPPSDKQKWHPNFMWQPIPVFSKPVLEEDLLDAVFCKRRNKIIDNLPKNSTVQDIYFKPHQELISYVAQHSGLLIKDFQDLIQFYFILKAEDDYGLQIPEWTKSIYPEPLHSAAGLVYGYMNFDPIVKKIQAGYLVQKILKDSMAKVNNKLEPVERKLFLYSGHESTLGNFLYCLKVFKTPHVPPYGSAVIIELHKHEENYYLKLQYLKHPLNPEITDLTIPDCDTLCPIDRFMELQADLLPSTSFTEFCDISDDAVN